MWTCSFEFKGDHCRVLFATVQDGPSVYRYLRIAVSQLSLCSKTCLRRPLKCQLSVVPVNRWSLKGGALVSLCWSVDQLTVVSVDR